LTLFLQPPKNCFASVLVTNVQRLGASGEPELRFRSTRLIATAVVLGVKRCRSLRVSAPRERAIPLSPAARRALTVHFLCFAVAEDGELDISLGGGRRILLGCADRLETSPRHQKTKIKQRKNPLPSPPFVDRTVAFFSSLAERLRGPASPASTKTPLIIALESRTSRDALFAKNPADLLQANRPIKPTPITLRRSPLVFALVLLLSIDPNLALVEGIAEARNSPGNTPEREADGGVDAESLHITHRAG